MFPESIIIRLNCLNKTMPSEEKVIDQFLEEVPKVDQLEAPIVPEEKKLEGEVDPEAVDDKIKNRQHRRLEAKLQAEREANIALNARLQQIAESKSARESSEVSDYLKDVERLYGTQTPEAIEATNILKSVLSKIEQTSTEKALSKFREEQALQAKAVKEEEARLDSFIEDIEDKYGVSLNEEAQRGFFKYLARISPKDEDGNIVAYADHEAAWEDYQEKMNANKPVNKAKSLAARSMTQSGASPKSTLEDDSSMRFLKENGIL